MECAIQTVKKVLKKTMEATQDPNMALLILKSTPLENNGPSAAELMFNRQIRTTLPIAKTRNSYKSLSKREEKRDRGHDLPELKQGDIIRYRKDRSWSRKGKVIRKSTQPRSYKIMTDKGTVIRRNRQHLLLTREAFEESGTTDVDSIISSEETEIRTRCHCVRSNAMFVHIFFLV